MRALLLPLAGLLALIGMFFNPQLLLIAAVGFALALTGKRARSVVTKPKHAQRRRRLLPLIIVALLVAAIGLFGSLSFQLERAPLNVFTAGYSGDVRFDRPTGAWRTMHRYELDMELMAKLSRHLKIKDGPTLTATKRVVTTNMERLGWAIAGERDEALIFERTDATSAEVRWWPLKTTNRLALPTVPLSVGVTLTRNDTSILTLQSPKRLVVETFPASSSRSDLLVDEVEQLSVGLNPDLDEVRVAVASPLARNAVTAGLLSVSYGSAIKWILAPLVGVLVALYKEQLTALIRRLLRLTPKPID